MIGFRGVSVDDEDRFALEVISQLLAGQSGRLFLELRDKQGLAYSVTATSVEGLAPGYFAVYIATAPEKLAAARAGLLDQLRRLLDASRRPTPSSRPRAATWSATSRSTASATRCTPPRPACNALYGLGAAASRAYPERIRAVSGKDVLRVAQRIVDLDAYTEAVVRGGSVARRQHPSRRGSLPPQNAPSGSRRSPRRPTSRAPPPPPRGRARAAPRRRRAAVAGSR